MLIIEQDYFKYIYIDSGDINIIKELEQSIPPIKFIVRDKDNWNMENIIRIVTNPNLHLIVINHIDEYSIMEIALAGFMCKQILITTNAINDYDILKDIVSYIEPSCNLNVSNNSFKNWYKLTYNIG